ncbi:hydantoinase B/oxoprolinase family protein [Nitrosophilus kaiyonis]|uniref:hydantoinase B/oxoprolinase family protein n=1 Tax=Nitrosophilus kaiyonis TaxID=2930200 RepID=UPI00249366AF|nr:hydantoinase B/oxoprolinase family protein [Nitrosophilus kaiyonis]
MLKIAIDRGGTFTDIYANYNGKVYVKKILSESEHYEDSNSEGIRLILKEIFNKKPELIDLEDFEWIRFGTTVATNALLERNGEDVTLFITKGFKDLLKIGYQNREDIFVLDIKKPKPLYKKVVEIDERVYPEDGYFEVLKELDENIEFKDIKSLAVLFLHSYGFDKHEKRVKELAIKNKIENISISSEVSSSTKAVERGDTAVVDAYLTPVLKRYIKNIVKNFKGDLNKLYFMKSDGNLCKSEDFRGSVALLSGPAGGVVALKSIYKGTPLIGFDMGGTSTDVSRYDGKVELKYYDEIAGVKVAVPSVDIHTVAAGGGSRLFYKNEMFVVGPESSGSNPGPLCYGKNGYLSITDANLVTQRLEVDFFPKIFGKNQNEPLNIKAAKEGFEKLSKKINKSIEEIAEGFIDVANENMANAIKEITIKKGIDVKNHILCSFGGAGGQHAVGVARKLGIKKIYIHKDSGILSAIGIANADIVKTYQKSFDKRVKEIDLEKEFNSFKDSADEIKKSLLLKYEGTQNIIEVEYKDNFFDDFCEKHKKIFGFLLKKEVIVESIKIDFIKKSKVLNRKKLRKKDVKPVKEKEIFLNGKWQKAKVYKEISPQLKIEGPALIIQESSTILLDEKSYAKIDDYGDIHIELEDLKEKEKIKEVEISLLSNRFKFIATKMGEILQKTAVSTNIKERLDFSCAIFDKDGNLISNAPHIPVHLGSMSSVVKSIIKKFEGKFRSKNVSFITNVPYEGGSHLPDITVITPFVRSGTSNKREVLFWVASRGHHADIGGITPGSMPPFSKNLHEEGAIIEAFEVVEDKEFKESVLRAIFESAGARNIEDNISDIKAQISANMAGIEGVKELIEENEEKVFWYMKKIQEISEKKVRDFFKNLKEKIFMAQDYLDNGAAIKLKVEIDNFGNAVFDFRGSSYELISNQNTPFSVVKSAVIYSIRVMLNEDIPLNEGIIKPIKILVDENSILNPSSDSAIVGGNVTTSQRVVDVIFKAFKVSGASQGCMNNIIFGDDSFGYYETIAGGAGATKNSDGADGVHTHMTNTKITDVEVLERNYPVKIKRFELRKNSGGEGKHKGGEGVVREFEFLKALNLSILTERRVFSPYGMDGGEDGKKGENLLIRDKKIYNLTSKASIKVKKFDRLVIKTPGGGGFGKK